LTDRSVHQRLIGVGGDPFFAASLGYPALAELTPSQREKALREYHAAEYREHIRRIVARFPGVTDEDEEE